MVFAGLILTFLMINLFSVIPAIIKKIGKKGQAGVKISENQDLPPVPKDHLAIIAAVLDIEKKLQVLKEQGRFTFKG